VSGASGPDWLAELQGRFGSVLRSPLDRSTGTLRATSETYDPEALADVVDGPLAPAEARLAVYNRQYWFRLFGVMQTAFPLTARLLGHWLFNDHAARFFLAHPPHSWDIDRAPEGFEASLALSLGEHPHRDALIEAAGIDSAWRALFRAPEASPFRPGAGDAARLLDARLVPSPAVAVISERWAWLQLKSALSGDRGESAVALPERLAQPRWWALVREPGGVRHVLLEAREGELLSLLGRHSLRDALAALEASCPEAERAALPAHCRRWLARSVERGFWVGLRDADDQGVMQL